MENRTVLTLAFIGSIAALLIILYMGFGIPVPDSVYSLQPTDRAMQSTDFLKPINEFPELMLRFFTADTLLILSGVLLYLGMFTVVSEKSHLVASMGLGIGILTILLDSTENAFLITYAQQSMNGVTVTEPALPFVYVIANLKMTGSYAGFLVFGLAWPREAKLDWTISSLMILYAAIGVLSLVAKGFILFRGLLLLLCFVFFVCYFFTAIRSRTR